MRINRYCILCKRLEHKYKDCAKTQGDVDLQQYMIDNNLKQCPRCKNAVEKKVGCDHITCLCGYEFCYRCGGVYKHCECGFQKVVQVQSENIPHTHFVLQEPLPRTLSNK